MRSLFRFIVGLLAGLVLVGGVSAAMLSSVSLPTTTGQNLLLFKATESGVTVTGAGGLCHFGVAIPEMTLAFSASVTSTDLDLIVDIDGDGNVSNSEHCLLPVTGVDFSNGSILMVSVESAGAFMTANGLRFYDGSSFGNIPGGPRGSGLLSVKNADTVDQYASLYGNVETGFGTASLEILIFNAGYTIDPNALPPNSTVSEPATLALVLLAIASVVTIRRRASR